jgi:hypothetical protein
MGWSPFSTPYQLQVSGTATIRYITQLNGQYNAIEWAI